MGTTNIVTQRRTRPDQRLPTAHQVRLDAALVIGARNLGGAIVRDLLAREVRVAAVARTQADLDVLEAAGAVAIRADAEDPQRLARALSRAAKAIGPLGVIVNAASAARQRAGSSGFGGGSLATAGLTDFEDWTVPAARQAFVFLREGARALDRRGGALVQITGAPARRASPQRGLLAAGCAAVRALSHAAAQELRGSGIHVALLVVDGIIKSPKTEQMTRNMADSALVRPEDVAHAVRFLATQSARGQSHELVITPAGDRWLP